MNFHDFLERSELGGLKIQLPFREGEFKPGAADRLAAWDLYVELLTRITIQPLPAEAGDEKAALTSVFELFGYTRESLKKHGPGALQFARLAIPVLNQIVRPFTAKWHKLSLANAFESAQHRKEFRNELSALQGLLRKYARALASIAAIEDLTELEQPA
jgi:hypothetical protein